MLIKIFFWSISMSYSIHKKNYFNLLINYMINTNLHLKQTIVIWKKYIWPYSTIYILDIYNNRHEQNYRNTFYSHY